MGKAGLFVVIFLVFAIGLSLSGIFILDHIKPDSSKTLSPQAQTQDQLPVTTDDGSTLIVSAILKGVSQEKGAVYATVTVQNNGRNSDLKMLLFDGKVYPAY